MEPDLQMRRGPRPEHAVRWSTSTKFTNRLKQTIAPGTKMTTCPFLRCALTIFSVTKLSNESGARQLHSLGLLKFKLCWPLSLCGSVWAWTVAFNSSCILSLSLCLGCLSSLNKWLKSASPTVALLARMRGHYTLPYCPPIFYFTSLKRWHTWSVLVTITHKSK